MRLKILVQLAPAMLRPTPLCFLLYLLQRRFGFNIYLSFWSLQQSSVPWSGIYFLRFSELFIYCNKICTFHLKKFFEELRDWTTLSEGVSAMLCVLRVLMPKGVLMLGKLFSTAEWSGSQSPSEQIRITLSKLVKLSECSFSCLM